MDINNVYSQGLENSAGRRVLFYIASELRVSLVEIPLAFQEYMLILLKGTDSNCCSNQLLLGNIYRSPSSTQDNDTDLSV